MKLTWFGGMTFRVHLGGVIVVVEPAGAPVGVDRAELVSGADQVMEMDGAPAADLATWRPRKLGRLLDQSGHAAVEGWRAGEGLLILDAPGEPPLVIGTAPVPPLGRWAGDAVVVLAGSAGQLEQHGRGVLQHCAPRLLALAGDELALDVAVPALAPLLDGTGLVALERGMAVEV